MERPVDGLEEARKHHRKCAVDEGAVDDEVDLVEAVLQDGDAHMAIGTPAKPTTKRATPTCQVHSAPVALYAPYARMAPRITTEAA
jgi:hypothetical protein